MAHSLLKQANFLLPVPLLRELRSLIPQGEVSQMVREALEREIERRHFAKAIQKTFGAWKHRSHPELKQGSSAYIQHLRRERRFE